MGTSSHLTPKFIKGIWVTGNLSLNDEYIIGRTCIRNGRNTIASVTQSGSLIFVPFEEIRNLKLLNIVRKTNKPAITSSFCDKPDITIDEELIVEILNTINCKN